jgi:hypothetical protein
VTGTRIQGLDLKGAVQAYQVDRELIDESGATSVVELFNQLPIAAGGGGTFSTASAGALTVRAVINSPPCYRWLRATA